MKHRVTLKSTFDNEGCLKTFEVVNMSPPFDIFVDRAATPGGWVGIHRSFNTYIEADDDGDGVPILWLWPQYHKPRKYYVIGYITREKYQQALKVWNKAYEDLEVVDVNNKIIGEL